MTLFLPRFPEKEGSDYYENEACYAFNVIRRQQHAGWVNGCQYRIAKQDCSEHYHEQTSREKGAIEILKERYARGEIIREEFLEMKKEMER